MQDLDYELALALKRAGFPQKNTRVVENCTCGSTEFIGGSVIHPVGSDCLVYAPTLPELIEACGAEFNDLAQKQGVWEAWSKTQLICVYGSRPTEAVARLWLALQGK